MPGCVSRTVSKRAGVEEGASRLGKRLPEDMGSPSNDRAQAKNADIKERSKTEEILRIRSEGVQKA